MANNPTDAERQAPPVPRKIEALFPWMVGPDGDDDKKDAEYGDTSAPIWNLYRTESEKYDKMLVESWMGNTDSMLIFTGLFSAIISAFLVETYRTLQPDTDSQTVTLLSQLVLHFNASTSVPPTSPIPPSFDASGTAIRVNILMVVSLFLSVSTALASTLIQQWARDYLRYSQPNAAPHKRGRVRAYLFSGLSSFQMRRFIDGVPVLLHVSVFLFYWALSDFLHMVNTVVGTVARYSFFASLSVYLALSLSPLLANNSPYRTALTTPLQACIVLLTSFLLTILHAVWRSSSRSQEPSNRRHFFRGMVFDRPRVFLRKSASLAAKLDNSALRWLLDEVDDHDMDGFLAGLSGYLHSRLTDTRVLAKGLTASGVLWRIKEHFTTCALSFELTEEACMARVIACVNSLRLVFELNTNSSEQEPGPGNRDMQPIIEHLDPLCRTPDTAIALRASCVRSLAFQEFLRPFTRLDAESPHPEKLPDYLVPLHSFFWKRKGKPIDQWAELKGSPPERLPGERDMWSSVLRDGPLVNLTVLIHIILTHANASELNLSMCHKTLDTLLQSFGVLQVQASEEALARFKEVYSKTRAYVGGHEQGGRITRVLRTLEMVDRGMRLATVFVNQPISPSKVEIIFTKEHLRNSDLLEAFAGCLPKFVTSSDPNKLTSLMKSMVLGDSLWVSIQVNLQKCMQSDRPFSHRLRIFVACLDILDVAFTSLEHVTEVDWRSPAFGQLILQMDKFVATKLSGVFTRKNIYDRIALFNVQVCRALLSRYSDEPRISQDTTAPSRSSWDHAALSKLVNILGVGEKEDGDYWESLIQGGKLSMPLTKVNSLLTMVMHDGALLNFCKLGRMIISTIRSPAPGGGPLDDQDAQEQEKLLDRMAQYLYLPQTLDDASAKAWTEFGRLSAETLLVSSTSAYSLSPTHASKFRQLMGFVEQIKHKRPATVGPTLPATPKVKPQPPARFQADLDAHAHSHPSPVIEPRPPIQSGTMFPSTHPRAASPLDSFSPPFTTSANVPFPGAADGVTGHVNITGAVVQQIPAIPGADARPLAVHSTSLPEAQADTAMTPPHPGNMGNGTSSGDISANSLHRSLGFPNPTQASVQGAVTPPTRSANPERREIQARGTAYQTVSSTSPPPIYPAITLVLQGSQESPSNVVYHYSPGPLAGTPSVVLTPLPHQDVDRQVVMPQPELGGAQIPVDNQGAPHASVRLGSSSQGEAPDHPYSP